jgi:hypothetical protein
LGPPEVSDGLIWAAIVQERQTGPRGTFERFGLAIHPAAVHAVLLGLGTWLDRNELGTLDALFGESPAISG